MHRTKCSNVIKNVWAPHFMKELCEDVGAFSILLYESTDITTDKYLYLGCTVIYFSLRRKKSLILF
jgi:hypothetical protein